MMLCSQNVSIAVVGEGQDFLIHDDSAVQPYVSSFDIIIRIHCAVTFLSFYFLAGHVRHYQRRQGSACWSYGGM